MLKKLHPLNELSEKKIINQHLLLIKNTKFGGTVVLYDIMGIILITVVSE